MFLIETSDVRNKCNDALNDNGTDKNQLHNIVRQDDDRTYRVNTNKFGTNISRDI